MQLHEISNLYRVANFQQLMYQRDLRGDSSRNDSQESEELKKSSKIDWESLCQNENAIDIFKEEEKQPNYFDISIG